jgi:hypothetical protein
MITTRILSHKELVRLGQEVAETAVHGMSRIGSDGSPRPLTNVEMLAYCTWKRVEEQRGRTDDSSRVD